jgi:hypothetical protein
MAHTEELKTHVTQPIKRAIQTLARQQGLTEAAWLRRLVEGALQTIGPSLTVGDYHSESRPQRPMRLTIQVRADDRELLEARARARYLASETYVSFFLRAHLRALAPLPVQELAALKRAVAELGAIGRNINQIARMAQQSGRATAPAQQELISLLKVCEGLRDHVKALIRTNLTSWEAGMPHRRSGDLGGQEADPRCGWRGPG